MIFESDRITAAFDEIHRQSMDSAETFMVRAKRKIDEEFGDGYAAAHPELVAAFMKVASEQFAVNSSGKVFGSALDRMADAIEQLAPPL